MSITEDNARQDILTAESVLQAITAYLAQEGFLSSD